MTHGASTQRFALRRLGRVLEVNIRKDGLYRIENSLRSEIAKKRQWSFGQMASACIIDYACNFLS